jgi:glycerol-3-phosphate dehydrogenase
MLQWEWLGGLPPLRRAAVIGAGAWGTTLATILARSGVEVDLGCHTAEQVQRIAATGENAAYLPGVALPDRVRVLRSTDLELSRHDLVVFAVPAAALPAAAAMHAPGISDRTAVLVAAKGLVPPLGALPSSFVAERVRTRRIACVGGPSHARLALDHGAALIVASADPGLARQLKETFGAAGFPVSVTDDLIGVELAGCAKNAAALAAAAAGPAGANAAGAAAGMVFGELDALARASGARPQTFSGLAGVGDLVATVLADGSRNRRAGELLAQGMPAADIGHELGQTAEAVATVPLLADRGRAAGLDSPALDRLAGLIDGTLTPARWAASLTEPPAPRKRARAA